MLSALQQPSHEMFMQLALGEAIKAFDREEVPIGCVIVHKGKVIARAFNQVEQLKDPTAHAEMLAITQATEALGSWRLTDTTLYTTLEPCPMCAGAIHLARIPTVFYAAADPKKGACRSLFQLLDDKRLNHQSEVHAGLCAEDSELLLKEFFETLRRNPS